VRISVVIPSLNHAAYLDACLKSVLDQDHPDLECIVVDGGSTDGSVEIIRRYQHRLAHWTSEPDRGHYDAVNKGMARATGEIAAWLNADDLLVPRSLAVVAEVFAEFPDVEWITGVPTQWDKSGRLVSVPDECPVYSRSCLRRGEHDGRVLPGVQQESCFWRRWLWEKAGGIRTQWDLAGDFDLWVRMAEHADLVTVCTVLAGSRQHIAQRSVRGKQVYFEQVDRIAVAAGRREWLAGGALSRWRSRPGGQTVRRLLLRDRGTVVHWETWPHYRWMKSRRRVV
jgi:glycosyltransferase involved in cell wall biosynthesis